MYVNNIQLIIFIQMESIVPKCINNSICSHVCNVKSCKASPFLCVDDECQCYSSHQKCITNMRWKVMKQLFSNKLKRLTIKLDAYFTQINQLYKSVLKQIEISYAKFKNIPNSYGLSQIEREVFQKLKQKKYSEMTGQMINKVEAELIQEENQFQVATIQKSKIQIEKQTAIIVQMLEALAKLNIKNVKENQENLTASIKSSEIFFKLDSKITQDVKTISSFFSNKKIQSMNLLYRASENNFQANKFRDKCDGRSNTITILKTEFGNVIGGYTPLPWKRSGGYSTDNSKQSFIFSLTNKHKLNLIEGKQNKAIRHNSNYGPIFGKGRDLIIYSKANQQSYSYAKPGQTYNNGQYTYKDQQSYKKFSGQSSGSNFRILQWQVYEIVFYR